MKFEFHSKFLNWIESKLNYLDWSQLHAIYNFLLFLSSVVVCNSTKHKLIHTLAFTKKERKKEYIYNIIWIIHTYYSSLYYYIILYIQFMGSENVEIGSGASWLVPKAKLYKSDLLLPSSPPLTHSPTLTFLPNSFTIHKTKQILNLMIFSFTQE